MRQIKGAWASSGRESDIVIGPIDFDVLISRRIADGLSKTFAFVEQTGEPFLYEERPDHHELGPWPSHVPSDREQERRFRRTSVAGDFHHHELGPSHNQYSGMEINRTNRHGIFSFHNGVNVVMCDGSVHFLSQDTSVDIVIAKFSRNGGSEEAMKIAQALDHVAR